jgi:hypothetical protein
MTFNQPGATVAPIAVSEFKNLGGDDQGAVSHDFVRVLRHDLELSGFFSIISPKSYIEDPQNSGYDLGKFNFGDWSSLNADFLVKGAVTVSGGQVSVETLMFDVAQQRRMFGTRFSPGRSIRGSRSSRRAAAASRKSTSPLPTVADFSASPTTKPSTCSRNSPIARPACSIFPTRPARPRFTCSTSPGAPRSESGAPTAM